MTLKQTIAIRFLGLAALMIHAGAFLHAEGIRVTQVDVSRLLLSGEVGVYVSPGDADASSLESGDFLVTEADGTVLEVTSVDRDVNRSEGINFLLLIDNSGSMYDENGGAVPRIEDAKTALDAFVAQVSGSPDSLGVSSFNTLLEEIAPMGTDPLRVKTALRSLSRPSDDMAYTELYRSLNESILALSRVPGRKAMIVLSDGEDYPFFKHSGSLHPEWGESLISSGEVTARLLEAGITLYGINFADRRDPDLEGVVNSSGGKIFDARGAEELGNVYADIRNRIQNEVRLTLRAPPYDTDKRTVTVRALGSEDSRDYVVPLLFGAPGTGSLLVPLLFVIGGLGLLALLFILTFERPAERAQIQTVDTGMTIALTGNATVIGSSADAQMTIAGNPAIDAEHATIMRDDTSGTFTLVSKRRVRVNNNPVTRRELTPGDVIQIEGTSIVFDAPVTTQVTPKGKKPKG